MCPGCLGSVCICIPDAVVLSMCVCPGCLGFVCVQGVFCYVWGVVCIVCVLGSWVLCAYVLVLDAWGRCGVGRQMPVWVCV